MASRKSTQFMARGIRASNRGAEEEALALLTESVEADSANCGAHMRRGLTLAALGRLDEALAGLETAVLLEKANPVPLCFRAMVLADAGRFGDAYAAIEDVRKIAPGHRFAHGVEVLIALKEKDLGRARALIKERPVESPLLKLRLLMLVEEAFLSRGAVDYAVPGRDEVEDLADGRFKGVSTAKLIKKGEAAFNEALPTEALEFFLAAEEKGAPDEIAVYIGEALLELDAVEAAGEYIRKYAAGHADDFTAPYYEARYLARAGKGEEAARVVESAWKKFGAYYELYHAEGLAWLAAGKRAKAARSFKLLLAREADIFEERLEYALRAIEAGRFDSAAPERRADVGEEDGGADEDSD